MARSNSPMILATAVMSLAVGFGAASLLTPTRAASSPIVNPDAWEEVSSDEMAQPVSYAASARAERCNPWEVSDVAMEAILDEMLRRGWRAPSQGYAVSMIDPADTMSIEAVDPNAPMPPRGGWPRPAQNGQLPMDEETDGVIEIAPGNATTPLQALPPQPAPPQPATQPPS